MHYAYHRHFAIPGTKFKNTASRHIGNVQPITILIVKIASFLLIHSFGAAATVTPTSHFFTNVIISKFESLSPILDIAGQCQSTIAASRDWLKM